MPYVSDPLACRPRILRTAYGKGIPISGRPQSSVTRAVTGRWSLPVAGSVRTRPTVASLAITWSILATGKDAGKLNANPRRDTLSRDVRGRSPGRPPWR